MALAVRSGSTRRWRKLRAFVLRRDGKRCVRCGGASSCNVTTSSRALREGSTPRQTAGRCVRRVTTPSTAAEDAPGATNGVQGRAQYQVMLSIHAPLPGLFAVRSPTEAFHRADATLEPASVERDASTGDTHAEVVVGTSVSVKALDF